MTLEDPEIWPGKKSGAVLHNATETAALELLVTACPLCLYNLNQNARTAMRSRSFISPSFWPRLWA